MKTKLHHHIKFFSASILFLVLPVIISCNSSQKDIFLSQIGVCTGIANANMLAADGYTYIEASVGRFLMPDKSDSEFATNLEQNKNAKIQVKACNNFIPGKMKSVGNEAVHEDILKYMETAFSRAQKAGVQYIVFGSGGSRSVPEGFSRELARQQFVDLCSKMAPVAAKYDVVVVLEPLNTKECNFINSVAEGGKIVEEVNHPNFRLLADIYHMLMDDETPENLIEFGHLIKHVHIAEKEERAAPGTHNEDFSVYLEALKKVDYKGMLSIECNWKDLEKQAATAIDNLNMQLKTL